MDHRELIIVGGGIAGAAAALRAAQYHLRTTWIVGDRKTRKRSRSEYVFNIDNMIGIHPGLVLDALGDALPGERPHLHIGTKAIIENVHQRLEAYAEYLEVVEGAATDARKTEAGYEVQVGEVVHGATNLILATGMMDRQPVIAKEKGGKVRAMPNWIYPFANAETVLYCIRCEGHLTRESRTAVLGHSESAAQVSLMLAERYGSIGHLFTNGAPCEASEETLKLLRHFEITVHEEAIVDLESAVKGDKPEKGRLGAVHLEGGERHPLDFVFVSLGTYRIYNDLAVQLGATLMNEDRPVEERHVRIDSKAETDQRGLFAIGDMALRPDEPVMKQVYTSQEYAVRAVDTVDRRRRSLGRKAILAKMS